MRVSEKRAFALLFCGLALLYGFWLLMYWPGILGEDGKAILMHVENPQGFNSGKTRFWFDFVSVLYGPTHLIELPIAVVLLTSAFVMARILSWCWARGFIGTSVFLLLFICIAPQTVFFLGILYPDGIFSVAVAGLCFETALACRERRCGPLSLVTLALCFPFAVFARENGWIFIAPVLITVFLTRAVARWVIGAIVVVWTAIVLLGPQVKQHEAIFPLAVYETVNFLQPRPMQIWHVDPLVSQRSINALTRYKNLDLYLSNYDSDYWDPLNFKPGGPYIMRMPTEDQKVIIHEFFFYNLWHNIPRFIASRVNIFLVSALAQGGLYGFEYKFEGYHPKSSYRPIEFKHLRLIYETLYEWGKNIRWLLWTPFLGIALLFWALRKGFMEQDAALLLLSIPMVVQLCGIFFFSIAGEYRYLLPFFMLPLAILPLLAHSKARRDHQRSA